MNKVHYKDLLHLVCEAHGLFDSNGNISLDSLSSPGIREAAESIKEDMKAYLGLNELNMKCFLDKKQEGGEGVVLLDMEDGEQVVVFYEIELD